MTMGAIGESELDWHGARARHSRLLPKSRTALPQSRRGEIVGELREKLSEWLGNSEAIFAEISERDVFVMLDTYSIVSSLFRDRDVERAFLREPKSTLAGRSMLDLIVAGEIQRAHEYARQIGNL